MPVDGDNLANRRCLTLSLSKTQTPFLKGLAYNYRSAFPAVKAFVEHFSRKKATRGPNCRNNFQQLEDFRRYKGKTVRKKSAYVVCGR